MRWSISPFDCVAVQFFIQNIRQSQRNWYCHYVITNPANLRNALRVDWVDNVSNSTMVQRKVMML